MLTAQDCVLLAAQAEFLTAIKPQPHGRRGVWEGHAARATVGPHGRARCLFSSPTVVWAAAGVAAGPPALSDRRCRA